MVVTLERGRRAGLQDEASSSSSSALLHRSTSPLPHLMGQSILRADDLAKVHTGRRLFSGVTRCPWRRSGAIRGREYVSLLRSRCAASRF